MSAHRILGLEKVPGLGCSPIKVVRELGSERRETVRSLSVIGRRILRRICPGTERTGLDVPLVYQLFRQVHRLGSYVPEWISAESI